MAFIHIDEDKCRKDGICVRECPFALIRFSEKTGFPEMIPGGEMVCTRCGHCVTVCPHAALDHERMRLTLSVPIAQNLEMQENRAEQFLRSRRSVRLFERKPVEKEKINRLIDVARYAPTAGNRQAVEWIVHLDQDRIRQMAALTISWMRDTIETSPAMIKASPYLPKVISRWESGTDSILWNAPVVIIATAPKQCTYGLIDVTIALSHLELMAPTIGLGTCWAGLFQSALLASPDLRKSAGIPDAHPHHYPMMLGYPVIRQYRLPSRKSPKITFI